MFYEDSLWKVGLFCLENYLNNVKKYREIAEDFMLFNEKYCNLLK